MRFVRPFAVALLGVLLVVSMAQAQQERPTRPGQGQRAPRQRRQTIRAFYERALQQLNLEEVQKTQINEKLKTHQQEAANWQKQFGEEANRLREQLTKAREDNDEKALRELTAKRAKLNSERSQLEEKLHGQVLDVIRAPEKKEGLVRQILRGRRGLSQAGRVRLALLVVGVTSAQKDQAGKLLERAEAEAAKIQNRRERAAPLNKAVAEIKTKVLQNEAKAKKLDELLRSAAAGRGMLAALNLSAEQQKKVDEIMAEARKAQPEERRNAMREAMRKIREEVLTEEQRQQLSQRRPRGNRPARTPPGGE